VFTSGQLSNALGQVIEAKCVVARIAPGRL